MEIALTYPPAVGRHLLIDQLLHERNLGHAQCELLRSVLEGIVVDAGRPTTISFVFVKLTHKSLYH